MIRASPGATMLTTSPPSVWKVRRKAVPEGTQPSGAALLERLGGTLGAGLAGGPVGLGELELTESVTDGVAGVTARSSAAESGWVRVGAAAISTDRMPNQAIPTVTAVATAQAIR